MDRNQRNAFDFERWRRLAEEDPAAFESARTQAVTALIESARPESQRRLQGLQWRIDRLRERAPNPMAACLRLSGLMWDSLLGKNGLFETLRRLGQIDTRRDTPVTPATIVPFKGRLRHSKSSA